MHNFYFNFLHRNIATNKFLLMCKLVESSLCNFCNMEIDSIEHIFWSCQQTQIFWNELFKWLNVIGIDIAQEMYLTFFHSKNKVLTYILLFAKFYIYNCKTKMLIPSNLVFKQKLLNRISIERYIAFQNDSLDDFNNKWRFLLAMINTH